MYYNNVDQPYDNIKEVASSENEMFITFSSGPKIATGFFSKIHNLPLLDRDPLSSFCTITNPCGANKGHCYHDQQCSKGLKCGLRNCPIHLGYSNKTNCCYEHCNAWLGSDYLGQFVTSPNYPNYYPNNTECSWTITAPPNKTVTLKFQMFNVRKLLRMICLICLKLLQRNGRSWSAFKWIEVLS